MENTFERELSREQYNKTPRVVLHLFRHGQAERDPNKSNQAFELSDAGRQQALGKSKLISDNYNLDQSVAFGSPRIRAQQTAGFAMAGETVDAITGDESLDELKQKIDEGIKVGSKIGVDPRLDFYLDKNTPFGREAYEAVFITQDYMRFLVNRSDKLAIETGDQKASTYSRQASDVAKIVNKYIQVGERWNQLVESGAYEDPKLERFLGSHGGVVESFLLKVVERVKGVLERDKLLMLMPHQFDYTEGIDVTLVGHGPEQTIHIVFRKIDPQNPDRNFEFNEDVPREIIEEIMANR